MRFAGLFVCAVLAGCGIVPRDAQFTCPDGLCPSGFVCAADGLCHSGIDAGPMDAPLPDTRLEDVGLEDGLDVPDPLDAPGLDAPDAGLGDAGGALESCAPDAMRRAVDEDLDGRVDEGCGLFLGPIHPVLNAMPVTTDGVGYFGGELTSDGRHLYTTAYDQTSRAFLIASRGDPTLPFAQAVPAAGSDLPGFAPSLVTVTGDGLEVYLQLIPTSGAPGAHIFVTSGSPTTPWSTPVEVLAFSSTGDEQVHPHIRRDALEIYFVARTAGVDTIMRSFRAARGGAWSAPSPVGLGAFPILSPDFLSLYFMDAGRVMRVVTRGTFSDPFPSLVAAPALLPTIEGVLTRPFFSDATREVFFSLQSRASGAVPLDGPTAASVFRAEVCRDAACSSPRILCTGTAIRSADGFHCYRRGAFQNYAQASTTGCMAGEHLLSIHSAGEADQVRGMLTMVCWLGLMGRAWQSGEPFLYDEFGTEPTPAQCAHVGVGWPLDTCTASRLVVCESDLWPAFTTL